MKLSAKHILIFVLATFTLACTSTYNITVREDHSAHVSFNFYVGNDSTNTNSVDTDDSLEVVMITDTLREFYNSSQISNLDLTYSNEAWNVVFDIANIDSLGNFINPIRILDYPVTFTHTENSLIITGSDGKASTFEDLCGCSNLVKIKMNLTFERKIQKVITENSYVTKSDGNNVSISTSIGEMDFSGKQNRVEVKLK